MSDIWTLEELDRDGAIQEAAEKVDPTTRTAFLKKAGIGLGAVAGGSAFLGAIPSLASAASPIPASDIDILNFALTLEYLEADFYNSKGKSVGLSGQAKTLAKSFGDEEAAHVDALAKAITSLGGKPVKMPKFAFPVTNQSSFLKLAYVLENTGVGAYNGAAPALTNSSVLAAAGTIVQTEARHAASIAVLTGMSITPNGAFDKPLSKKQVLAKAGPLIK